MLGVPLRMLGCAENRISTRAFAGALAIIFLGIQTPKAALDSDSLQQHQAERNALFQILKAAATNYTFTHIVINLPAGTVPGKNFPIPVSHIRYDSTVLFAFDSFALEPGAEQILNDLARIVLKDHNFRSLLVVGHTDSVGLDEYNNTLSKKRGFTVATTIQAAGVNAKYISVIPMGKAQPVATNSTEEGRKLNRRVEFFISDIPEATEKAVELVPFNPCFRNDQNAAADTPTVGCDNTLKRVPIYNRDGKQRGLLALRGKPPERPRLPNIILKRPSLRELDTPPSPHE